MRTINKNPVFFYFLFFEKTKQNNRFVCWQSFSEPWVGFSVKMVRAKKFSFILIASKRRQPIALAHNFHLLVRLLFNTRPHASARQANFVFSVFRFNWLETPTNDKHKKRKSYNRLPAPHQNFVFFPKL